MFLTNNKTCLRILSVLLMKANTNWDLRVMFSFVTQDWWVLPMKSQVTAIQRLNFMKILFSKFRQPIMGWKINEGFLVPSEAHLILEMSQSYASHISHRQCSLLTQLSVLLLALHLSRTGNSKHWVFKKLSLYPGIAIIIMRIRTDIIFSFLHSVCMLKPV